MTPNRSRVHFTADFDLPNETKSGNALVDTNVSDDLENRFVFVLPSAPHKEKKKVDVRYDKQEHPYKFIGVQTAEQFMKNKSASNSDNKIMSPNSNPFHIIQLLNCTIKAHWQPT